MTAEIEEIRKHWVRLRSLMYAEEVFKYQGYEETQGKTSFLLNCMEVVNLSHRFYYVSVLFYYSVN